MKKLLFLFLAPIAFVGCASDQTKDYDGAIAYQIGLQAEQRGDLASAREYYAKAQKSAHSGRLGPAKEAYASYGWARISGYMGFYADAEKGFESTLSLIDKAEGDADSLRAPVLFELAQMLHDTGQHAKAVKVYVRAFAELERRGIERIEPWGYAGFLDDYADSLRASGNVAAAADAAKKSQVVKDRLKGTTPRVSVRRYKS